MPFPQNSINTLEPVVAEYILSYAILRHHVLAYDCNKVAAYSDLKLYGALRRTCKAFGMVLDNTVLNFITTEQRTAIRLKALAEYHTFNKTLSKQRIRYAIHMQENTTVCRCIYTHVQDVLSTWAPCLVSVTLDAVDPSNDMIVSFGACFLQMSSISSLTLSRWKICQDHKRLFAALTTNNHTQQDIHNIICKEILCKISGMLSGVITRLHTFRFLDMFITDRVFANRRLDLLKVIRNATSNERVHTPNRIPNVSACTIQTLCLQDNACKPCVPFREIPCISPSIRMLVLHGLCIDNLHSLPTNLAQNCPWLHYFSLQVNKHYDSATVEHFLQSLPLLSSLRNLILDGLSSDPFALDSLPHIEIHPPMESLTLKNMHLFQETRNMAHSRSRGFAVEFPRAHIIPSITIHASCCIVQAALHTPTTAPRK